MPALTSLLTCQSFFSEGRSTISPKRQVALAKSAGYTHLGLADWGSVAGAVELFEHAKQHSLNAIIGCTLPIQFPALQRSPAEVFPLTLLAKSRAGYGQLCELITHLNVDHPPSLPFDLLRPAELVCLTGGRDGFPSVLWQRKDIPRTAEFLRLLRGLFRFDLYVQLTHDAAPNEERRLNYLRGLARDLELPTVAAPDVTMGLPDEYPLLDALTCAREGIDVNTPQLSRPRNDARCVHTPEHWGQLLPFPDAILNAQKLASECSFDLLSQHLSSPLPKLKAEQTPQEALEGRVQAALPVKYPGERQQQARERLEHELATVASLDMAGFFLTAAEVTDYCQSHGILAAGRGSAAGSVICYLLGITLSDPIKHNLLFERFLHTGRTSMPDVDIDIASSRRDQVLAWVEERFGGQGKSEAMVANRITYRLPSAVQDLGRALGLPPELRDRLSRSLGRDYRHHRPHRAREAEVVFTEVLGEAPVKEALLRLLTSMEPAFFRHHAPHSGGTVLSSEPLTAFSPLVRSSGGIRMLTFDKDDVEKLGLIKLDLLGLRMLAALERAREEVLRLTGAWVNYGDLPDDSRVWQEISSGDTMGLFQIESPAQVQMTARLKPRNMTDLAHQIALVRPGPIQSGTVHPYVRRSRGEEPVPDLPEPLAGILASTFGTLMFQEQILRIAVHYAGYSWPDADRFRSRLSKVEDQAELSELKNTFVAGAALTTGAFPWEAEEIFGMCAAFRGYGFAESHAWAFAQHSYASAYMRFHHPAAYFAAFLTEAPGMWPAQTISHECRRRKVQLLPACINRSGLSYRAESRHAIRVPLIAVDGISEAVTRAILQERLIGGKFRSVEDFYDRVELQKGALEQLVKAGVFDSIDTQKNRREAFYVLKVISQARPSGKRGLLTVSATPPELPALSSDDLLTLDLETKGLSETGRHPLDAHRARLRDLGCQTLASLKHGLTVWAAGVIVAKQRPPTAKGFAFYVLEDSTARVQAIISPDLWEANRVLLRDAGALIVCGEVSRTGRAVTIKVNRLTALPLRQFEGSQAAD